MDDEDIKQVTLLTHEVTNGSDIIVKTLFQLEPGAGPFNLLELANLVNQSEENDNELYDRKLPNGLVFNYGAFTYEPYVNLEKGHGIELHTMLEYCKKFYFVCTLTKSHSKWGEVYGNASDVGILGWVANGTVDAGLGGFYLQGRKLNYVDYVGPSIKIGNSCLVPMPSVSVDVFTVLQTFSPPVWLTIAFTFILFLLVTNWAMRLKQGHQSVDSSFFVITIFLQQSSKQTYSQSKSKIRDVMSMSIFFTLVIAAAYTSQLYSALTKPKYENIIRTVTDLDDSEYYWGANHISYIEALQNSPTYSHLITKFVVIEDEDQLIQTFYDGKFGLLLERLTLGYILKPEMKAHKMLQFTTMIEDLYWVYGALMIPKNTPFRDTLHMHIMHLNEGGIQIKWEKESFWESNFKAQVALCSPPEDDVLRPLTMGHVQGIFLLWLIGIFTGIITFLYELWHHKSQVSEKYLLSAYRHGQQEDHSAK